MTPAQHQKLAALRRMADHASTPENERTSAKRRITEMEEKYGAVKATDRTGFLDGFTINIESFTVEYPPIYEARRTSVPPRSPVTSPYPRPGVYAGPYEPPLHNCRCRTVPVDDSPIDPEAPFSGTRLSEFADYILSRWTTIFAPNLHPGPYGRVSHVARGKLVDDNAVFVWPCPQCRGRVRCKVSWREAGHARADQKVMDRLLARLSSIWAGYKDNRCSSCNCHTAPINKENNSEWIFQEWEQWCCGRNPGLHGRVTRFWKERDVIAGNTRYCWYCPTCNDHEVSDVVKIVRINAADLVTEYATPTAIKTMLFAMLNGDTNNRCSRCSRSSDVGKQKEEDNGNSGSDRKE